MQARIGDNYTDRGIRRLALEMIIQAKRDAKSKQRDRYQVEAYNWLEENAKAWIELTGYQIPPSAFRDLLDSVRPRLSSRLAYEFREIMDAIVFRMIQRKVKEEKNV